jgi:voltage-gated potassium channel
MSQPIETSSRRARISRAALLRSRFGTAILLFVGVNLIGVFGYQLIEGWSWLDALFMTVITETTIGYGETHPLSEPWGRIFTIFLIFMSISTAGYTISTVFSFIVEGEFNRIIRGQRMDIQIAALKNHYIICGAGDTGRYVAEEFHKTQTPFVIIDRESETLLGLKHLGEFLSVHGDATHDATLIEAGIQRAKGLVSVLSDDKDNVFVVLSARSLNPNLRIVSRVVNEENREKLRKAGANEIVSPNAIGGLRMASVVIRPAAVTFLDQMLRVTEQTGQTMRVSESHMDEAPQLIGKTLAEANIEQHTGLLVLALKSNDGGYQFNPNRQTLLRRGDILIVMGTVAGLAKLQQLTKV